MDTPPSLHSTVMMPSSLQYGLTHKLRWQDKVQVNLCQKLLFLHQLTHNMTTYCSLNYKFNTWKFQTQTEGGHVVYRNCFWHSEIFCTQHVCPMFCKKKSFWQRFTLTPRSDGLVILALVLLAVVFSCLILFMLVAAASLALQLPMLPPLWLWWCTCALVYFSWLLDHVIYLKLRRE